MDLLDRPEYRFLRTDSHLGKNIIFLTYGGSYAYGTNVEGSDIDIRGCTLDSKADLLGVGNFEQVVDDHTDTTVYGFHKLLGLLINCNPNTIELLGCKPEHYFVLTSIGKQLIDQRKMFLSRRAVNSFGGDRHLPGSDHDLLMDIRNGRYQKADHTFNTDFYDLLNDLEQRLEYAKENTSLPETPNLAQIEAFQMEVSERVVQSEI